MRILKIQTLPKVKETWVDKDIIMVHSCFQLLVDFIELEDGLNHCDYKHYKTTIDECKYLYDWWKENSENIKIDDENVDEHLKRLIDVRSFMWT